MSDRDERLKLTLVVLVFVLTYEIGLFNFQWAIKNRVFGLNYSQEQSYQP